MADPVAGQLLTLPYEPTFSQPGGVGTAVVPAITVGQKTGMFFPGCGHSIRSWDIRQQSIGGVTQKLVCCPECGYVQKFLSLSDFSKQEIIFA